MMIANADEMTREFFKDLAWDIKTKTATANEIRLIKKICGDYQININEFCEILAK